MLGDRHSDAGDVDFLKCIGAEEFAADLSGNADHWRRIKHGGGNAGDHVGGTRAGSRDGHTHATGGTGVAIGHVRSALFVAHQNVMELGLSDRVVDWKNRATWVTENVADTQVLERFAEDLRTSELHSVLPVEAGTEPEEKLAGTAVMAPSDEEETSRAYLAMTPCV